MQSEVHIWPAQQLRSQTQHHNSKVVGSFPTNDKSAAVFRGFNTTFNPFLVPYWKDPLDDKT